MKKMELQKQRLLSYSVVFPERNDKIDELLSSIPSNSAVEFVSYNLSRKANQLIGDHDISIWAPWVLKTRADVKNPIGHYAEQFNLGGYALVEQYSMLLLISRLLEHYNGRNDELNQDDYSNLLLAYLLCCDERLSLAKDMPYNEMSPDDFIKNYLPFCLKYNDVDNPRDYRLLLIKCYLLLIEFPKCNAKFSGYVKEFCKDKGIEDAKRYLDELFLTFLKLSEPDLSNCLMEVGDECYVTNRFFDNLSIDTSSYKHDADFLLMKEHPILKTGHHRYNFMYKKFFLDKAYTGLLFDMKASLVSRGVLDSEKGYGNLKSFLGETFSERFFFYSLMRRCFGARYIHHRGEEMDAVLGTGMPDYYLRRGNRVFLFECKDAQIAAEKKLSGDYEVIKRAIYDKYVVSQNGHPKGVSQLANVIIEKLPSILENLDGAAPQGVKYIFPIIVYFDSCFDVEGPNYLLNKEFRNQLLGVSIPSDFVVKDLVMVNVEQLMRLENFFADEKIKLAATINNYIEFKRTAALNQVFPFNKFLFQEARRKGYALKKTRWFDEVFDNLKAMDNQ